MKRKEKHSPLIKLLVALPGLLLIVAALIVFFTRSESPWNEFYAQSINDSATGGQSEIRNYFFSSDGTLSFSCFLDENVERPYAGIELRAKDLHKGIDLTNYSKLKINLDPRRSSDCKVTLYYGTNNKGCDSLSRICQQGDLMLEPNKRSYTFDLTSMITPSHCISESNISREELAESRKEFLGLSITTHPILKKGYFYSYSIDDISFVKSTSTSNVLLLGALFYSIAVLIGVAVQKKKKVFISYKKLEVVDHSKELRELVSFISCNYNKKELSQPMVSKETGLTPIQIRELINNNYGKSFKQYITELRMNEAKRLITETEHQINLIAKTVGYSHTTSFNHVFKEFCGFTPVEFRKRFSLRMKRV